MGSVVIWMQIIEINSHKISRVFYQHFLLTIELKTGEKFLYRTVVQETFDDFMNADNKDKFYKTHIQFNDGFKRIQLFGWLKIKLRTRRSPLE